MKIPQLMRVLSEIREGKSVPDIRKDAQLMNPHFYSIISELQQKKFIQLEKKGRTNYIRNLKVDGSVLFAIKVIIEMIQDED